MLFASSVLLLNSCRKQLRGYSVKQAQNIPTQLALCFYIQSWEKNIVYHWPKGSSSDAFVIWGAFKKLQSAR